MLLPPSKGKAAGGDGPTYGASIDPSHPLAAARREVLDAVEATVPGLDESGIVRVCGVGASQAAAARQRMASLSEAVTLPAHRRYTGIVHGNAGLASCDPATLDVDIRIVSALLGLATLAEPVPAYRLEFAASLHPLGGLASYWRERLEDHLRAVIGDRRVWDLLPGEHARMWPGGLRDEFDVVGVRFVRPDGRAANAARTKVAKGRVAAWLMDAPKARPCDLVRHARIGDGWTLRGRGGEVIATTAL